MLTWAVSSPGWKVRVLMGLLVADTGCCLPYVAPTPVASLHRTQYSVRGQSRLFRSTRATGARYSVHAAKTERFPLLALSAEYWVLSTRKSRPACLTAPGRGQ